MAVDGEQAEAEAGLMPALKLPDLDDVRLATRSPREAGSRRLAGALVASEGAARCRPRRLPAGVGAGASAGCRW